MQFSVAELIKRAERTRQPELVLAEIRPSVGLERDLRTIYARVVRRWGAETLERIMPAYRATLAEGVRDTPANVESAVDDSGAALTRLLLSLGPALEDWVVRVEQWHRGRFVQLFTPTGVRLDTLLGRGDVAPTLEAVLRENVGLIRSLSEQMRNGVSGAVFRGLQNRSTAVAVGREIRKVTGIARARAELIAADQLQKLTGRLDQERQQQLGINEFQWAHSRKLHPREHHKARDGKRFKWNGVVARTDPPGRAIRCGCKARAVVKL
jgi:SPP1 gp7 family putative phage head morphogenesis protein